MFFNKYKYSFVLLGYLSISECVFGASLDITVVNEAGAVVNNGDLINKSLQEQVGSGTGSAYVPDSSGYIIARDPARAIRRGRQLFQRKFSEADGLGPRVNYHSSGDITTQRRLGAGLSDSCASCHGLPRGSAGFGGHVSTFPDGRDAPHLFGLGIVEQLADEITTELRRLRDSALSEASKYGFNIRRDLWAKGVYYGYITATPFGDVDTSQLLGIDTDLRVKPFFAQGKTISIREFINGALKDEMGLETWDPVLCRAADSVDPKIVRSVTGFIFDPRQDSFERPVNCDRWADNDGDGVVSELDPALVDYLEFYLLNYFKPAQGKKTDLTEAGVGIMNSIGCTTCHVRSMEIKNDRRVADVDTKYDEQRGIFNDLYATASTRFYAKDDGNGGHVLAPKRESFWVENIFTDFKRHDLGPAFHERDYDGSTNTMFMTEPLWGVGSTAPYGHDGRSIDLDQVIRRHGGEAQWSRDLYVALSDFDRLKVQEFLRSLVLFPPDDTASNLNPGDPNGTDLQSPAVHGNIALPVLYQIPEYGAE